MLADLRRALRALLPPTCAVCGVARGDPVCRGCLTDWLDPGVPRCPVCALRSAPLARACGRCQARPPAFDGAVTLGDYVAPLSGMVLALKAGTRLDLAPVFARLLADRLDALAAVAPWNDALVVPLPLAWERQAERGFNQARELARALARRRRQPLADALVRVRHGVAQHTLDEAARRRNVRNAFAAPRPLTGADVLLVDDVCTTGATLDDAARALKAAGAGRVCALTIARTPLPAPP